MSEKQNESFADYYVLSTLDGCIRKLLMMLDAAYRAEDGVNTKLLHETLKNAALCRRACQDKNSKVEGGLSTVDTAKIFEQSVRESLELEATLNANLEKARKNADLNDEELIKLFLALDDGIIITRDEATIGFISVQIVGRDLRKKIDNAHIGQKSPTTIAAHASIGASFNFFGNCAVDGSCGIAKNMTHAKFWWRKASAFGNNAAKNSLVKYFASAK